jgi:hypothetical protein
MPEFVVEVERGPASVGSGLSKAFAKSRRGKLLARRLLYIPSQRKDLCPTAVIAQ